MKNYSARSWKHGMAMFCAVLSIFVCRNSMAEGNTRETLGKAIGGVVGGLFGGVGEALCNAVAVMPDIPELKTNTITKVDTSWLQPKPIRRFCGITLGETAQIDDEFLNQVQYDINAQHGGYYYNSELKAIAYEGAGQCYSKEASSFFCNWGDQDVRVLITPITHKVVGVYLNFKKDVRLASTLRYEYGVKKIEVITSRPIIEKAFEDAVGRKFFVEEGAMNIGYGTHYISFDTDEYPIDKSRTPDIMRKICTRVWVGEYSTWNLLKTEGEEFENQVQRRLAQRDAEEKRIAEQDRQSIVKHFCGAYFGYIISKDQKMNCKNHTLWGRFSLREPLNINGRVFDAVTVYASIISRRIYKVVLNSDSSKGVNDIVELLMKKYPWRKIDELDDPIREFYGGTYVLYRCGDVELEIRKTLNRSRLEWEGTVSVYNITYSNISDDEARRVAKAEADAAEKRRKDNLKDAFNAL